MHRGVWQCRRMVLSYCERGGSSKGVRNFLETMLVPFAEHNPQISIQVAIRPHRYPQVVAEYLVDKPKALSLKGLSAHQVSTRIQLLRDMRPLPLRKWDKAFRSTPSVQGAWEMGHELTRPHRVLRSRAVGIEPGAGTLRLGDSPKKWSLKR
jgi:large subunit ribosomal protein L43